MHAYVAQGLPHLSPRMAADKCIKLQQTRVTVYSDYCLYDGWAEVARKSPTDTDKKYEIKY